ncbi:MAG: carboxypeptidase regulatory-like domain-containing protein [Gemmatimonadaceae bacterium]
MHKTRLFLTVAASLALVTGATARLHAQGVTTGAVSGTVTDPGGAPIEGAQVQLRNAKTGASAGAITRGNGQYTIQGVEPDAGYSLTVRRIGFQPATHDNIRVSLGQATKEDFSLVAQSTVLETVTVSGATSAVINPSKTGTGTTVSDSALRRLPTLNRNFADFVSLVPQVSTVTGFLSGGGINVRQNAIQIDGAAAGDLFGLGTTGQPGSQANAKSVPLDAVKEYQVLLSPFDIRQGNFGGLLINAVTKSGSNEFHGSVYGYTRNQNLTRSQPYLFDFLQQQYGAAVGGPIIKNRVHFFFSMENQKQRNPQISPFLGSPDSTVSSAAVTRLQEIMSTTYGFADIGSGERTLLQNPNRNIFARIDAYLPFSTRLVLRHNYSAADRTNAAPRSIASAASPTFGLSSNSYLFSSKTHSSVAEFLTNLPRGMFNELLLNKTTIKDFRTVPVTFPQVTVLGFPRTGAGASRVVFGTESSSQGNSLDQNTFEITENFTVPVRSHSITLGTKDLFYKPVNLFAANSLGSWQFADTTALKSGTANRYQVSAPAATDPANGIATFRASLLSYYLQDVWQATPNFALTVGARWDKPHFKDTPPLNPSVLTDYNRATNEMPDETQFSPRVGFNWDIGGNQRNQLRGGLGYFTGPPPFVYLSNAFGNSGLSGFASLTCDGSSTATTSFRVPTFNAANIATPPTQCAPNGAIPGATTALGAAVATIDPNFKFPKYLKGSIGYDHRFSSGLVASLEGLFTTSKNNVFYQNLALTGPQYVDRFGRTIYGTIGGTLTSTNNVPTTLGSRNTVLDLSNSSGDHMYSLTGTLQKAFTDKLEGSVSYSYSQARDVTTTTSSTQGSNFRFQRDVSGNLLDKYTSRSKNDMPHKIVATGSYRLPTNTDISFIYQGGSGAPYDYVYGSGSGTGSGDANADGQSANDLLYVPANTFDPTEILFTGFNAAPGSNPQLGALAQAAAFDAFINSVPCLRNNRGKLLTRNICRNPWINEVDISIGQSLTAFHQQNLQLRLDVINFGNLLNPHWGLQYFSDQGNTCGQLCSATILLTQTGNQVNATDRTQSQGVYTFDTNYKRFNAQNAGSNYRMQLSMRYSF